jgi:hypothetical protein
MTENSKLSKKELIDRTALCQKYVDRFLSIPFIVIVATLLLCLPANKYLKNHFQLNPKILLYFLTAFILIIAVFAGLQVRRICKKFELQCPNCRASWNLADSKATIASGMCKSCNSQLFDVDKE